MTANDEIRAYKNFPCRRLVGRLPIGYRFHIKLCRNINWKFCEESRNLTIKCQSKIHQIQITQNINVTTQRTSEQGWWNSVGFFGLRFLHWWRGYPRRLTTEMDTFSLKRLNTIWVFRTINRVVRRARVWWVAAWDGESRVWSNSQHICSHQ